MKSLLCTGKPEQSVLEGGQAEGDAVVEPEHVALTVDIPVEDGLFSELHEVYLDMYCDKQPCFTSCVK